MKSEHQELVNINLKKIGEKVRLIRRNQFKNYEDFAKQYGFNKVTINRLENGENSNLGTLIMVLIALEVSLNEFFKDF
jgi:transcriptional regulator with XRE-family HTH domain